MIIFIGNAREIDGHERVINTDLITNSYLQMKFSSVVDENGEKVSKNETEKYEFIDLPEGWQAIRQPVLQITFVDGGNIILRGKEARTVHHIIKKSAHVVYL